MSEVDKFYNELLAAISNADGPAFVYRDKSENYPKFIELSEKIHSEFSHVRGMPIITILQKDVMAYATFLAIILSGNTFVPLSKNSPPSRNAAIIRNFDEAILIVDQDLEGELIQLQYCESLTIIDTRSLLRLHKRISFEPTNFDPDSNAMIYFTSGSTGEPKGVCITHNNFIPVIRNLMNILPWPVNGVFADLHETSFVISIPVLFSCWFTQSAIAPALTTEEVFLPVDNLLINKVNVLITVPSTISRIKKARPEGLMDLGLDIIINCGEPLHLDILEYCFSLSENVNVYNFYGSTEVSPWTFYYHCEKRDSERFNAFGCAPIGTLLPGNKMAIDERTSELLISGPQVTPGYLNDINTEQFLLTDYERWYRTGDRVTEFEGLYHCKGRLDSQIKLNGYRIEVMEVESQLRTLNNVNSAVCFVCNQTNKNPILAAVISSERKIGLLEVRNYLHDKFPNYMIPRRVFNVRDIPVNKNGKVDRLAIKAMFDGK